MERQNEVTRFVSEIEENSCISRLVVGRVVVNSEGIRVGEARRKWYSVDGQRTPR